MSVYPIYLIGFLRICISLDGNHDYYVGHSFWLKKCARNNWTAFHKKYRLSLHFCLKNNLNEPFLLSVIRLSRLFNLWADWLNISISSSFSTLIFLKEPNQQPNVVHCSELSFCNVKYSSKSLLYVWNFICRNQICYYRSCATHIMNSKYNSFYDIIFEGFLKFAAVHCYFLEVV